MEADRLLAQIDELRRRLEMLAHENASLRAERDIAFAQVKSLTPKATPEQEDELRRQLAGPWLDFSEVVAQITGELRGGHDGQ